jgi:hypothetical protein
MKSQSMKHPIDDIVGAISGLFGGTLYVWIGGITWQSFYQGFGQLIWLAFVAFLSGAMGILGKHLMDKYIKRKKRTNE